MRTIQVSDETWDKIKDQVSGDESVDISSVEDMVGKSFYFRTVTYHLVGNVKKVMGNFLELKEASWVADSGRFMNAIRDGELSEVEPVGTAFVNLQSVTDFFNWKHPLPKDQK